MNYPALLIVTLVALLLGALNSASALAGPVPVAAYSFDESSGATVKDTAGNHDGTINGATRLSTGKYGGALDFDGVDDLVSIPDAKGLDLTTSFTLEAWVRPDTLTAGPTIGKTESSGGISGYALSARYSGYPTGHLANAGTIKAVSAPAALPIETWAHIAFTFEGTNLRFYVNGKLVSSSTSTIAAKATAANLEIGHSQILNTWFNGQIDEVRLYDQALSESQIQVDRDTAVGLDQIPVAAYSFDEGSGTTLGDSIGDHDGTISGATWTTGKYGSALDVDGIDDLVSIPDADDLDLTSSFTLEAWVRPDTATDWSPVIAKNENPESGYGSGYVLFSQGPGKPRGWLSNAGATKAVTGSSALPTNEWSHLAFTSDGTNLRLYLNGTLVGGPVSASVAGTTASVLEIGRWAYLNKWFDGLIDEIRLYDESLSESQIQTDRDNRVQPPALQEVTTSVLDTGSSAEKVSSVPITASGTETVIYSLAAPSIKAGETLRVTGNLEVTNAHTYDVTDSVRLVLGSNASDTSGTEITPWTSFRHIKDILHWTFPINGLYEAPSSFGSTQYLKVIFKAASASAKTGETLIVQPNFGRLAATGYVPAVGPMSQPTHQLQALTGSMKERTTNIPVDEGWRLILSRKVGELSVNDILDITGQLEIQNTNSVPVQVESRITASMAPSAGGDTASAITTDRLTPGMSFDRFVHSNQLRTTDPAWRYLNLVVRAKPLSGAPSPLTITAGRAALNVLRMKTNPGDPSAPLRHGTLQQVGWDIDPDVESIPFCSGGCEKRVVASAPVYDGIWKDEVLRVRGAVTGDFNGGTVAQVLTQLVLADSPTATSGTVVAGLSGDKVPTAMQLHTSVKEGTYVVPRAELGLKYLNFVVYASRTPAYEGESMKIPAASLSFTRSRPTFALNATYEDGSLDQFFRFDNDGVASVTSTLAREGEKSMEVNLDFSNDNGEDPLERRRVEVSPPDERTSGGYYGEDTWHGFSVYFPEDFKVPGIENPELPDGTWNIFAQWHAEHDGDGLDCPLEGVGVPIGFGVRHWKANGYKNPGASETSTPVDGDYLEVSFIGGELNQDCTNTIKEAPQRFILGLLERGRWYDFVLHTRWTTEEGGPANSVAELWVDGKQVLGNQSTPVTSPVLLWHGIPAIHNNAAYLKFGIYRGPSKEEPKTRLFIDSFRRGNSYQEVAP